MFEYNNIDKELEDISTVLKAGLSGNIYKLPEDYFEKNSLQLLNIAATSQMEVPVGYFDNLAENVLSRIKTDESLSVSEEIEFLSPVLTNLSNENVYSLQQGYFEDLASSIISNINPARVIKMKPFYKYAVAAVITGLLGLGIFNNLFKPHQDNILKSEVYKTAHTIIENQNFDNVLETVPADEAAAYLTAYGQDVNSALAALSAEDYSLSYPDELFINDTELDHFLNVNNINPTN